MGVMRHSECKLVESLQNDLPKIAATICDTWRFKPESSAVLSVRAASACSARLSKAVFSSAHIFLSVSNFFLQFFLCRDTELKFGIGLPGLSFPSLQAVLPLRDFRFKFLASSLYKCRVTV